MAQAEIKAELQAYLTEKNLNATFVTIVEAILIDKPDNPIGFMAKFLLEKYPEETKDIKKLFESEKPPSIVVANEDSHLLTESDCSSVDSDESLASSSDEQSKHKPPLRKKRRESVCAEQLRDNEVAESELKVIEKTEEEAARILHLLETNVFFNHLDQNQMKAIQNAMFLVESADGEVIIEQGDDGDNFYIIDSGSVDVFIKSGEMNTRDLVKTCEAGDGFGELAIMYNSPRAASCIAKGDVRLWALDRVSFKVILMQTTISKRKVSKGFLQNVPVFSKLTEYETLTIADALQEEVFEDGAIICHEGDQGDKFYLVKDGTAVCTKTQNDGRSVEVARLSSGNYFGEIALLTTKPRQATVSAEGVLKCLSLERKTFNRVMGPLQDILTRNIEAAYPV